MYTYIYIYIYIFLSLSLSLYIYIYIYIHMYTQTNTIIHISRYQVTRSSEGGMIRLETLIELKLLN